MTKSKYSKFFITDTPPNPLHPQNRNLVSEFPWVNTMWINEELQGKLKGAFYMETNLVLRPQEGGPESGGRPQKHDWDEYLVFLGTDPEDPFDLRGEVEFWVEDEKHIITRTCALFIPRGVFHTPFYIRRVDRPFVFITTGNTPKYSHLAYSDDPKYSDYMILDEIAEFDLGGRKYKMTKTYAEFLRWRDEQDRENSR
jgi:hypothetical protein